MIASHNHHHTEEPTHHVPLGTTHLWQESSAGDDYDRELEPNIEREVKISISVYTKPGTWQSTRSLQYIMCRLCMGWKWLGFWGLRWSVGSGESDIHFLGFLGGRRAVCFGLPKRDAFVYFWLSGASRRNASIKMSNRKNWNRKRRHTTGFTAAILLSCVKLYFCPDFASDWRNLLF